MRVYVFTPFLLLILCAPALAQQGYYNNHYYEAVEWPDSWQAARDDAAFTGTFGGAAYSCHLATVTSAEENAFIVSAFPDAVNAGAFLGGYQCENVSGPCPGEPPHTAGWKWVTGEPWGYTTWNTDEPNQYLGRAENFLQFYPETSGKWNDVYNDGWIHSHYILECEFPEIDVNIKPGSNPNSINTCSEGGTPVAVFGSNVLDVTSLDPEAIVLASAQVKTVGKSERSLCSLEDIGSPDGSFFDHLDPTPDGYLDLICHFLTLDLALGDGSTEATVSITLEGGPYTLSGSDAVNIVKGCSPQD